MDGAKSITSLQRPRFVATPVTRHWAYRYGLAILLVAATIGLSLLSNRLGFKINFTIPVVVALVAGAWYGGRGPGLLIGVLFQATTIINFWLFQHFLPVRIHGHPDQRPA